jgi:hypothetical protein
MLLRLTKYQLSSILDKAWSSRLGKKLKFSLSESELEKTLEELRKLNQDFRTLAAETTKLDDTHQVSPSYCSPPRTYKAVQDYRLVRKASAKLHQALERACQMHEEHSAHFRLESQHITIERQGFPLVRFNMAFAHCSTGAPTTLEPVWIAVDSTFYELSLGFPQKSSDNAQEEAEDRMNDLVNTLKSESSTTCASSIIPIKAKSVRFDTTASCNNVSTLTTTTTTLITSFLADPSLPDFCVQHDFCKQLQKYGSKTPVNKYIGCFEKSGPYKHLVYFAQPITTSTSRQSFSFTQIIHTMSQSNSHAGKFLQHERLRLARQLASAVLQFHATPMLKDSWRSDDVVFFGTDAESTSLMAPHLNVQVGKSNDKRPRVKSAPENKTSFDSHLFVRNPYLFGLGVILIELARQAPLSTFREKRGLGPVESSQEINFSDYIIADRVSKSLGSSLGVPYAKVVRKCLGCDFGEGTTDLNDPGLQAVFYRDVVSELERLETAFAALQLVT